MKTHRYRVRSAQEAVERIRKELGEQAQVVSVKSLPGRGLARFWRAPLLEVTATVGEPEAPAEPEPISPAPPQGLEAYAQAPQSQAPLAQRLERLGIAPAIVLLLRRQADWSSWEDLPLSQALNEIHSCLGTHFQKREPLGLGPRVAFLGTPGVGKTTLLCKWLTRQIFKHNQRPSVLKLEGPRAQSDETLQFFTNLMDTPFLRSWEHPKSPSEGPLLVDTQGLNLCERAEASALAHELGTLGISTRILVLNLCYSTQLLQASCSLGQRMGATHVAFTQKDLCPDPLKLWPFLLTGNLSPAFFSQDPNPSGPLFTDFHSCLHPTPLTS